MTRVSLPFLLPLLAGRLDSLRAPCRQRRIAMGRFSPETALFGLVVATCISLPLVAGGGIVHVGFTDFSHDDQLAEDLTDILRSDSLLELQGKTRRLIRRLEFVVVPSYRVSYFFCIDLRAFPAIHNMNTPPQISLVDNGTRARNHASSFRQSA